MDYRILVNNELCGICKAAIQRTPMQAGRTSDVNLVSHKNSGQWRRLRVELRPPHDVVNVQFVLFRMGCGSSTYVGRAVVLRGSETSEGFPQFRSHYRIGPGFERRNCVAREIEGGSVLHKRFGGKRSKVALQTARRITS